MDDKNSVIESLGRLTDRERHMVEVRTRRMIQEQIDDAKVGLKTIDGDIQAFALRLVEEAELLSEPERELIDQELTRAIGQREQFKSRLEELPARLKLYRALGRPEATFVLGSMVRR